MICWGCGGGVTLRNTKTGYSLICTLYLVPFISEVGKVYPRYSDIFNNYKNDNSLGTLKLPTFDRLGIFAATANFLAVRLLKNRQPYPSRHRLSDISVTGKKTTPSFVISRTRWTLCIQNTSIYFY